MQAGCPGEKAGQFLLGLSQNRMKWNIQKQIRNQFYARVSRLPLCKEARTRISCKAIFRVSRLRIFLLLSLLFYSLIKWPPQPSAESSNFGCLFGFSVDTSSKTTTFISRLRRNSNSGAGLIFSYPPSPEHSPNIFYFSPHLQIPSRSPLQPVIGLLLQIWCSKCCQLTQTWRIVCSHLKYRFFD